MLSDKQILYEIERRNIVIEPFDKRQLGSNSYDVRLGEFIARGNSGLKLINVYNENDILNYWKIYDVERDCFGLKGTITVFPNETILSHTKEIIGGRNNITTRMNARSSVGRCGISVCKCAGFGDVGFINRWTMEITNHLDIPVLLKVGMRIAQISFFKVGETLKQYAGKYQKDGWKPEDMLPRLWEDWEVSE